ncbi:MAG: phospho-sugar mutase [Verrucomicrobia bacterium]|nr:phospho-sugar mutase [Verrucomicrobiota bacterium]
MDAIQDRIQSWLEGPYDEETKSKIRQMQADQPEALNDAFFKDLSFGTGGLRAQMGIGTNRLNIYTIRAATQGLANYLKQMPESDLSVFIGYDVRMNSKSFAMETARVLAGNGIRVLLSDDICPTPFVSFGCRLYGCQAAVMITASHNPPIYNGYKVYWSDGGQIVPPHDKGIINEVRKIVNLDQVQVAPENSPLIQYVGRELDAAYLKELAKLQLYTDLPPTQVLYTPLHGTGIRAIPDALQSWGFTCRLVEEQMTPDGHFTNAPSPNPEEEKALELGSAQLVREKADLLIATDPDADRVGIAILDRGKAIRLTGNQIACVCLHHICQAISVKNGAFIKTIVTTELFRKIAESYGALCFDVLTGFKYIAEQIHLWENSHKGHQYIFGGEESYGYLFGTFVRDKDAVSSSCLIAEAAALSKKENLTLLDRLHQLYQRYGVHRESLTNLAFPESQAGMDSMNRLMKHLRKAPPAKIGSLQVTSIDDYLSGQTGLPSSDVLRFWLEDGSKLVIRPSGTEPKIKIYTEVTEPCSDVETAIRLCDKKLIALVAAFRELCHV